LWQNTPNKQLWNRLIHILEYLNNTKEYGLLYTKWSNTPAAGEEEEEGKPSSTLSVIPLSQVREEVKADTDIYFSC